MASIDVDDTIRQVHGYAKQAAAYGYSKVRVLNIQLATTSTPLATPVIARARLRRGTAPRRAAPGGCWPEPSAPPRAAGVNSRILARADSAYNGWAFVGTAIRKQAWFSVTARMDPEVKAAIASIQESAWRAIKYPNAVFDEEQNSGGSPTPRSPRFRSSRSPAAARPSTSSAA
jgi:hypothetical protein